jgi:hypothetical protein
MFIGSMGNLSLLTIDDYYYHKTQNEMVKKEMETGQRYGMAIGGCSRLCPVAMGHNLVALFSLSMSIKDHSLHWIPGQVTDLLSRAHTCL